MTAKVSVVMSVYNGERFLREAVDSILGQTFSDFEFIIVDDGSCDGSWRILESYTDRRIVLVANGVNLGLARSLNKAFDLARGAYLARMDADDIALPHRLQRQLEDFETQPDLVLLGSNVRHISPTGRRLGTSELPLDDWTIRCVSLSVNAFAHPTVMMRAEPVRAGGLCYDTRFETTQDWELWTRLMQYGCVGNLCEPLVEQRLHVDSVSMRKRQFQLGNSLRVQQAYLHGFLSTAVWDRQRFALMNEVFYGDRRSADTAGQDIIAACRVALDLLADIERQYPRADNAGYRRFVIERCLRMGLIPPTRRGAAKLAGELLVRYPVSTIGASVSLIEKRLRMAPLRDRQLAREA